MQHILIRKKLISNLVSSIKQKPQKSVQILKSQSHTQNSKKTANHGWIENYSCTCQR